MNAEDIVGGLIARSSSLDDAARRLADLSRWVDTAPANAGRDAEARTWGRIAKVAEEAGEVVSAFIGVTGQNPRKGVRGSIDDVGKELLDVAVTALCAYEHLAGNVGLALEDLFTHIEATHIRAGLNTETTR